MLKEHMQIERLIDEPRKVTALAEIGKRS
jgi:hypothetical protein